MNTEYARGKPMDKERLAQYLEKAKGERTMKQFAEACGVNPSTFSRIANKRFTGASSEMLMRAIYDHAAPNCGFSLDELMDANGMVPVESPRRDGSVMRDGNFMYSPRATEKTIASRIISGELMRRVPASINLLDRLRLSKSMSYHPDLLCKSEEFDGNGLWAFDILSGATVDSMLQRNRMVDTEERAIMRRRFMNRRMFFERFARYVAAAYFNVEVTPQRVSFVVYEQEAYDDIFEEFSDQKFQGYVSLIFVDLNERKISNEFVFPCQDGNNAEAFFAQPLQDADQDSLNDILVDIDEIPFYSKE